ncbi:hypothetical protein [Oleiagrimonas sp. MCCC 1A03011]|uniref:hypothetical protein n=1 Tax=Oleiagrimonas sp. MCCC 1A03011 TaxID=1926883 RepID=UPI000DC2BB66|nr:hypothetical protein [Oleiagrimonas sp. MCCC 1A03011]RAP57335.1 hypothetical protein BTJ49_09635 [Oleiagrimonas sp. MCCC 1A03011]
MKWWEKTVEYYFILKHVDPNLLVSPLDGKEEKLGDTIISSNNKWVLIEFKRDESCLSSEIKKFYDYEKALTKLSDKDDHHYLIYGEFNGNFRLNCKTYFSAKDRDSIESALKTGIDKNAFAKYVEEFTGLKNPPDGGGGAGGLSLADYSLVACVKDDGNIVECMSISDYQQSMGYEPDPEPMQQPGSRSMRM